ncbi:hypothetical protein O181_027185 [Austropuccinia psidii MF-1]|uniref:PAS domain-containing protein n=1 Tax=Austropuccinia psidii MF-1 TaxID=1389203 RepID=A0A9Q3CQN0_9BASI|nr:hypothetical protein [Austropuccinia psidii MF-1]
MSLETYHPSLRPSFENTPVQKKYQTPSHPELNAPFFLSPNMLSNRLGPHLLIHNVPSKDSFSPVSPQPYSSMSDFMRWPIARPAPSMSSMSISLPLTASDGQDSLNRSRNLALRSTKRNQALEDLENWDKAVYEVNALGQASAHSHLPDWKNVGKPFSSGGNFNKSSEALPNDMIPAVPALSSSIEFKTSYPYSAPIQESMESEVTSLLSIKRFEYLITKPATRAIFLKWLTDKIINGEQGDSLRLELSKLYQWVEESFISQRLRETQHQTKHLITGYYADAKPETLRGFSSADVITQATLTDASGLFALSDVFSHSRRMLLESLYERTFKQFVTEKLVEVTRMKLHGNMENYFSRLGDSFVLSNPWLRDNPVVLVSPGFATTTGYQSHEIMGRNCRFLQGPGTSQKSVSRIRTALKNGESWVELLLNYRANGTPFYCLLSVLPLFDSAGILSYFVGAQVNVTDDLGTHKLSSLVSQLGMAQRDGPIKTSDDFLDSPNTLALHTRRGMVPKLDMSTHTAGEAIHNSPHANDKHSGGRDKTVTRLQCPKKLWLGLIKRKKPKAETWFKSVETRTGLGDANFASHIGAFSSMFTQLIFFKKNSHSITFVTDGALKFLGFPCKTHSEIYSSVLLYADFLDLIEAVGSKDKKRSLKPMVKNIIASSQATSFECNLTWYWEFKNHHSILPSSKKIYVRKPAVVHLTPLTNRNKEVTSYIATLS